VSLRVGILPLASEAHVGGGYTFEQELFGRLLELAPESAHRFVVLDVPKAQWRPELPANVSYGPPLSATLGPLLRRARRFRLGRIVARAGVDVAWSMSPAHHVPDVPYVTIVWDLQHRLQPLFPEVSAGREWASREREYTVRLRRAAAVIAGTEAGRREIAAFYQVPEERIHVLPHPTPRWALEAPPSAPDALGRFSLSPGYALFPAQLWPHKNHANLLLALARLRAQGLQIPLVLVGSDRGNGAFVRARIRDLGLEDQVRMLGFVTVEELVALYRGASCLAFPSLFGPGNLPPLEAFALGCPVLAADVAGTREQLGDAAVVVDGTSPEAIADGLRRLRTDEALRATLVARGRERARLTTGVEFVRGVFRILDGLEPYVRCFRDTGAR
jgi:glycosyltransferase involved in cell wall biosynthesis